MLGVHNKLAVPLSSGLSLYSFADLHLVSGKLDTNNELGGSWILGVGMQYAAHMRL